MILAIGGQAPKAVRSVECYSFKEDRWVCLFIITHGGHMLPMPAMIYYINTHDVDSRL